MYVRTYVRTYVCMYVCMYVRMYVYVCMYVYVRMYVCVRTYVCMHVRIMYVCQFRCLPYEAGLLTILLATNQFVVSSNRLAWPSSLPLLVYTNCKRGGKTGRDNL
jgi:hypothetical protein